MHATRKANKNLALFDFDGTLCNKDSFTGFIFYALSKRHILKQGLKILPWIQAYYLNIYPANAMRIKLFRAMFSDMHTHDILKLAAEYSQQLQQQLNPVLYQQLQRHQDNDDDVVIVSASVDLYLKDIAQLLAVDLICTEAEIINAQFTGHYATPDCSSAQKKIRILERYHPEQYAAVYAYGNSSEDLDMFSLADYTYMVGVDRHLPMIQSEKKLA